MKRGIVIILLSLIILISFVSAQESLNDFLFPMQKTIPNFDCSEYGIECGMIDFYEESISCGTCGSGQACIYGKCVHESFLGKCEKLWGYENCDSINYVDFIDYSTFRNTCLLNGCEADFKTKECLGTMPSCSSSVEAFCLDRGCEFDSENVACEVDVSESLCSYQTLFSNLRGSLLNAGTEYCRDQISGCGLSNLSNYETRYFLNNQRYYTARGMDPASLRNNKIYLTHEDLASIEEGGSIPISFRIEDLGLPEGMPVNFNIYAIFHGGEQIGEEGSVENVGQWPKADYEAVRAKENAITGNVDGEGNVDTEWLLLKEDLSLLKFRGKTEIYVKIKVNNNALNLQTLDGIGDMFLTLETKTGECSGTPSCSDYSMIACYEAEEEGICIWNEEANSCDGEAGISCELFDEKGFCKFYSCSWRADSFWERFTDWFKSLFGG